MYDAATNRIGGAFGYDDAGNVTAVPGRTVTYDAKNRQITAININSVNASYAYDGDGRRVAKTVAGVTTTFVYDAMGQLAAEYSTATLTETGTRYFTSDHLGSTRLLTDASGAVAKTYDYLPSGEEIGVACLSETGGVKFTGQVRDQETCEDFFEARYMSAAQGRFTSPDEPLMDQDPSDPQSWNLYSYVRNNPLSFTDPSGNECVDGLVAGTTDKHCQAGESITVSATIDQSGFEYSEIGWNLLARSIIGVARLVDETARILQPVGDFLTRPRDSGCMMNTTGSGVGAGAAAGLALSFAGGPELTVPLGAFAGGAVGSTTGLFTCMKSTGSGGGGGGPRRAHGNNRTENQKFNQAVKEIEKKLNKRLTPG